MDKNKYLAFCLSLVFTTSLQARQIEVKTDFESASIGQVNRLSSKNIELYLKNDNNNPLLEENPSWRNWWYVKLENVPVDNDLTIHIKNRGHGYLYMPVYSYDQVHWQHMDEQAVSQSAACEQEENLDNCELIIHRPFSNDTVWLARFYPYSVEDLQIFLDGQSDEFLNRAVIGYSTMHEPIELLTITDDLSLLDDQNKIRVWLHARTHPGETGSSLALEGLISYLLGDSETAQHMREKFIFNIVPMVNPDGVILGNYRTNKDSVDLEQGWVFDSDEPQHLVTDAPIETMLVNNTMNQWLNPVDNSPVSMALNLHSSNGDADVAAFLVPHFGASSEYSENEQSAWYYQFKFIRIMARNYDGRLEQPPLAGGNTFLNYFYPETWWWVNRQNKVVAMTLETSYGKAGFDHWVTDDDLRDLGRALAQSIDCFYDEYCPTPRIIQYNGPFKSQIYQEAFQQRH